MSEDQNEMCENQEQCLIITTKIVEFLELLARDVEQGLCQRHKGTKSNKQETKCFLV